MLKPLCATAMALAGLAALAPTSAAAVQATDWQARDIDANGTIDAWYDPGTDLTWLADANAAAGTNFDNGSNGSDGRMTLNAAAFWVRTLDVAGVTGWRLPTVADTGTPGCNGSYGGTDCGYNVDTTGSEFAHVFHDVLGNLSQYTTTGQLRPGVTGVDFGLVNSGPFVNLKNDAYWLGTAYASPNTPMGWSFFTIYGRQVPFSYSAEMYAWAVHSGDVMAVPEPASAAMTLAGLAALGLWRRRQTLAGGPA